MLIRNKGKRKKKTMGAILQTANEHIQSYQGNYYWGQRIYFILRGVWTTAFGRGYQKALDDLDPNKPGPLPKARDIL